MQPVIKFQQGNQASLQGRYYTDKGIQSVNLVGVEAYTELERLKVLRQQDEVEFQLVTLS